MPVKKSEQKKILKMEKKNEFKFVGFKQQESDNSSYYKMLKNTERDINKITDFVPNKSELFLNDNTKSKILNLFKSNATQPIILQGLPQSGKCSAIFSMLSKLNIYCPNIKEEDKLIDVRFFQSYPNEKYNKILKFQNCYYINLKHLLITENSIILDFLLDKCGNYKSLDGGCKIFIICNIHLLSTINQKKLANIVENYYCNYLFIMTTSKPVRVNIKLRSLSTFVLFPKLNFEEFTNIFSKNFKHLLKKQELQCLDKLYSIYQNNNYNLQHTLYQISFLKSQGKLTLKTFDKRKNYISLQKIIVGNIINKYCTQSNISNLEELRKVLLTIISLDLDLESFIKDTIKLLLTTGIDDQKKHKIINLGSVFSQNLYNADRPIIHFENFFIELIIIINS